MDNIIKVVENETHVLKIIQDDDAINPRDNDNLGTMVCWHNRYSLGDEHSYSEPRSFVEDLVYDFTDLEQDEIEEMDDEDLIVLLKEHIVILPLYLYDHSGITMNTSGFSCAWDSGQIGWIYVEKSEAKKWLGVSETQAFINALKSEVEVYDQYLTGDVYGVVLEEKKKCDCCENVDIQVIESCWGFYGLDYTCKDGAKELLGEEYSELIKELA
jgi:hypothetical protein